jgi:diadenosine tetraphosphate (Ap4A) HIT family hydrolase
MTRCFVCDKHAQGETVEGGVIWADELVYAGHCQLLGQPDIHLGWLIVEPQRHVPGLEDLTTDEAAAIGILTTRLAGALRTTEGPSTSTASSSVTAWPKGIYMCT